MVGEDKSCKNWHLGSNCLIHSRFCDTLLEVIVLVLGAHLLTNWELFLKKKKKRGKDFELLQTYDLNPIYCVFISKDQTVKFPQRATLLFGETYFKREKVTWLI